MNNEQEIAKIKIKFLKAFKGDSILISVEENNAHHNILIDGGERETYMKDEEYGELREVIEKIKKTGQKIDLLILTHIDDDHIGGILKWFEEDKEPFKWIEEIWFNSGGLIATYLNNPENEDLEVEIEPEPKSRNTSVAQGIEFGKYIKRNNIRWHQKPIFQGRKLEKCGLTFRILSPHIDDLTRLLGQWKKKAPDLETAAKEHDYHYSLREHIDRDRFQPDKSLPNGSSIAFIMTWKAKNFLFLADAYPSVIVDGLRFFETMEKPLKCELVKVSHHGSAGNSSDELLNCIDCTNYVISTNGDGHYHPHKKFLARLIKSKKDCTLYFNYYKDRSGPKEIFSEADRKDFSFTDVEIKKEFEFS